MAQPAASQASFACLNQLHSSQLHNRRLRPPDLEKMAFGDENRTPLRPNTDRTRRRDSKLLGLFSRQKSTTDLPIPPPSLQAAPASLLDPELHSRGGLRASLAEISSWPYGLQPTRSEAALLDMTNPSQVSVSPIHHGPPIPTPNPMMSPSFTTNSIPVPNPPSIPPPRSTRGALATWDPPPLFQGYPQAIRYVELPACAQSAEAILRMNGRSAADHAEVLPERTREKGKRKHRRASSGSFFKADWTTKIYILVTSGYLLQYSGEGSFDRLPEKILPLGKDSVAFASDVIPGRHWVVQVSASMDSDGTATADPRASILSRFPFRGPERRQASHFLMVFESAEEMDQWIAILRREIEQLGGKKNLSETGKPKTDDERLALRTQASQRTLVLRDPERFGRAAVLDEDRWGLEERSDGQEVQPNLLSDLDFATDQQSFDEMSTTNSLTSQDGKQLDNLREGSHRLSFISSGQRTFITSEGTSPAGSPTRTSFSSQLEDGCYLNDGWLPEPKPRPNAQAILQRRMSMQAVNPLNEIPLAPQTQYSRSSRNCHSEANYQHATNTYCTRNFSMPRSANKRFSIVSSPGSSPEPAFELSPHAAGLSAPPRPCSKRGPPPTLGFSRPLSVVPDHPSPISPSGALWKRNDESRQWGVGGNGSEPRSIFQIWAQEETVKPSLPQPETRDVDEMSSCGSVQVLMPSRMPRHSPSSQSRQQIEFDTLDAATPGHVAFVRPRSFASPGFSESSVIDSHGRPRRSISSRAAHEISPTPQRRISARSTIRTRRVSLFDQGCEADALKVNFGQIESDDTPRELLPPPPPPPLPPPPPPPMTEGPPTRPLPPPPTTQPKQIRQPSVRIPTSGQNPRVDSEAQVLARCRSMHQLTEGPPPAPPPTCALPPIPSSQGGKGRGRRAQSIAI